MNNFKQCLTLDQSHISSCVRLANLLANEGENLRAAKYFKHALKLEPLSIAANFGMGKLIQTFSSEKQTAIEYF